MATPIDYERGRPFLEAYRKRFDSPRALQPVRARRLPAQARGAGLNDLTADPDDLPLARFELPTGGAVEFVGRVRTAEVFIETSSQDRDFVRQLDPVSDSPVRLFLALAGPAEPVPWLIAAVGRSNADDSLLRGRELTDRAPFRQIEALSPVPELPSAPQFPHPDYISWSGYCGNRGEQNFYDEFCKWEYDPGPWPYRIERCTHVLSPEIVHTINNHRRSYTRTFSAGCVNGYVVQYQWRRYRFYPGWHWHTEKTTVHTQPGNFLGWHYGYVMRKRRVRFTSVPGINGAGGGVRAWTLFYNH